MGIKLMVEVLDHWQDAGLTLGERSDLLVLAENANDGSRETWPKGGVHQEYILRRVGKTAGSWKNAIAKLVKKGVLAYAVHGGREMTGFPGQVAVYRIALLCPNAPHDGLMGQCTRIDRATPKVTQSEEDEPGKGHLPEEMGHLSGKMGHLSEDERSTSGVTPTPPYPSSKTPSYTTPSSPAGPVESEPAVEPHVTEGGGGGGSDLRSIAAHIAASLDYLGQVPDKRQRQTIEARLLAALEAGWTMQGLAYYLYLGTYRPDVPVAFYLSKLSPEKLPAPDSLPVTVPRRSGGVRGELPTGDEIRALTIEDVFGDGRPVAADTWEQASARVRSRLDHKDGWHGGTDEVVAGWAELSRQPAADERPPHCGDLECDPVTRLRDVELDGGFRVSERCRKCHPSATRERASDLRFSA